MEANPKLAETEIVSCRIQTGICPNMCNQCYYNRGGGAAYYEDINEPHIPDPMDVGDKIVRMNDGHDSNIQVDACIEQALKYEHSFFNTSRPVFEHFPRPVVLTANPDELRMPYLPSTIPGMQELRKLMFVRLRASVKNIPMILEATRDWTRKGIPVVLTFMAYYDPEQIRGWEKFYEYKQRHINSYWCPTLQLKEMIIKAARRMADNSRLVYTCGTTKSNWCKDCRNCEKLYRRCIALPIWS